VSNDISGVITATTLFLLVEANGGTLSMPFGAQDRAVEVQRQSGQFLSFQTLNNKLRAGTKLKWQL